MNCVVINLQRANERREQIARQFENVNLEFEFFTGIDGHELSEIDFIKNVDDQAGLINLEHPNLPGMLGCWLSHRQVWRNALEKGWAFLAVFEDDVTLSPIICKAMDIIETNSENMYSFDVIFLDDRRPHRPFVPLHVICSDFSIGLVRHSNLGTSGYIITRRAMRHLLDRYSRMPVAIDQLMHADWRNTLQIFTIRPQVVFHGERFVDHGSYIASGSKRRRTIHQLLKYFFEFTVRKRVSYYRRANGFKNV